MKKEELLVNYFVGKTPPFYYSKKNTIVCIM